MDGPKSLQDQYNQYNKTVKQLVKYIGMNGLFEVKDGQEYSVYNNLNKDPFTWKQYNASANLRLN